MTRHGLDPRERIAEKVERDDNGCWIWTGSITTDGYGQLKALGSTMAHRVSYIAHVGPIPDGLVIDHLCRVRSCVNPEHLEVVTQRENVLRGIGTAAVNAQRTHCPKGHPYDEANTYHYGIRSRACRACNRERYIPKAQRA